MKMKKMFVIVLMLLLACTAVIANSPATTVLNVEDASEDNSFTRYDSAVGVTWLIGSDIPSLQYQHWITPGFGFTLNTGAAYSPRSETIYTETTDTYNTINGYYLDLNFFGQLQWALYTASTKNLDTRLYAWVLGGCVVQHDVAMTGMDVDGIAGAGFGFDINLYKHISIPVEFGYLGVAPANPNLAMVGNFGIRYRF